MLVVLLLLLSAPCLWGMDIDSVRAGERVVQRPTEAAPRISRPTRFYIDVFGAFARNSTDFFSDYKTYLGGVASTFDAPLGLSGGISSFQIPDVGIGVKVAYSRSVIRETYLFTSFLDSTRPDQSTTQDFTLTVVPAMLTLDYLPTERQFTTYIGVMAGLAFTKIHWTESLSTTTRPGARASGERYDESHVSPSAGIRAGVNLGWDSNADAQAKPGLFIEASYLFIPVSAPLFANVAETLPGSPARLREPYAIQAGGFEIHIGISLLVH